MKQRVKYYQCQCNPKNMRNDEIIEIIIIYRDWDVYKTSPITFNKYKCSKCGKEYTNMPIEE